MEVSKLEKVNAPWYYHCAVVNKKSYCFQTEL